MNLLALQTSARAKADEQTIGFISDAELTGYINQGQRLVYGKIVQRFENFFIEPGTALNGGLFNTVIGTQAYNLPTTMQKLVVVQQRPASSTNDNDWRKLEPANIANDRLDEYYPIREGYRPGFGYFIAGNKIFLRPVPSDVFAVRIWFVPRAVELVAAADIPVVPEEYHELIAEYAAIQCLRKSGESIWKESNDVFALELNNLLETIDIRDQQPEQMTITDDTDYYRNGF